MTSIDPISRIAASFRFMPLPRWGYAIYRCTYENDGHWNSFLDTLNNCMREKLKSAGREEMMESLHWHIFDDRSVFDGMSKDAVRNHFDAWVRSGADQPAGNGDQPFARTITARFTRYRYCLQVDAVSMDAMASKNYEKPRNDAREIGFVNLIKRDWPEPDWGDHRPTKYPEDEEEYDDEDEDEDDDAESLPEIDGSTEYDVGWMKVLLSNVGPHLYSALVGNPMGTHDRWDDYYRRPPEFPRI